MLAVVFKSVMGTYFTALMNYVFRTLLLYLSRAVLALPGQAGASRQPTAGVDGVAWASVAVRPGQNRGQSLLLS